VEPEPALELVGIQAGYDRVTVLRDISLTVPAGKIVALLGPNGAGKTTLLRTATGLLKPAAGTVSINGVDVTGAAPNRRSRAGLCLIPEGRGIFRSLTVRDNRRMQVPTWSKENSVDLALDVFPVLRDRIGQIAGTMSGGQRQMLALARSYLSKPHIVLLDEVSMGLAPKIVDEIFVALKQLASWGIALLLVEQYVNRALELADTLSCSIAERSHSAGPPAISSRRQCYAAIWAWTRPCRHNLRAQTNFVADLGATQEMRPGRHGSAAIGTAPGHDQELRHNSIGDEQCVCIEGW
jgi:branched-chain amino acid transport system ATP-binding protein